MTKKFFCLLLVCFMITGIMSFVRADIFYDPQTPSQQQNQEEAVEGEIETIVPKPKDVKEATAIYIFLAWIWLSIAVLIFFLRLKIKEVDRLHALGFFSEDKDVKNHL